MGAVCVHDVGMRRRCKLGRRTDEHQRPELGTASEMVVLWTY